MLIAIDSQKTGRRFRAGDPVGALPRPRARILGDSLRPSARRSVACYRPSSLPRALPDGAGRKFTQVAAVTQRIVGRVSVAHDMSALCST